MPSASYVRPSRNDTILDRRLAKFCQSQANRSHSVKGMCGNLSGHAKRTLQAAMEVSGNAFFGTPQLL